MHGTLEEGKYVEQPSLQGVESMHQLLYQLCPPCCVHLQPEKEQVQQKQTQHIQVPNLYPQGHQKKLHVPTSKSGI